MRKTIKFKKKEKLYDCFKQSNIFLTIEQTDSLTNIKSYFLYIIFIVFRSKLEDVFYCTFGGYSSEIIVYNMIGLVKRYKKFSIKF